MVNITLNDPQPDNCVPSYTTLDKIEGIASITCPTDLEFDEIHITFQGTARAFVEKIATSAATASRSNASHNFLRLSQPIPETDIPENRIAKAGQTYNIPFTFAVPERLLPQSCTHPRDNERVLDAHLTLPPSLGDPMTATDGKSLLDDLAPSMTVISYAIRFMMVKKNRENRAKPTVLVDSLKKLRIIPAVDELPSIPVSGTREDEYTLRKVKDFKKGMFKGKLGRLTVEATQPTSLRLPQARANISETPVTTMALINLRFDPADDSAKPPRLGQLNNKLKVATFFSVVPMRDFPCKANAYLYDAQSGVFVETITLSSRNVESAQWTQHNSLERHDSAISISDDSGTKPASQHFYTSQLLVPVDLPTTYKTFVPTFHSCLISRVYSLDLNLSIHGSSATVSTPSMHLKIPLQISAEGNPDARPIISEEEAQAIAARQMDSELEPRSFAPPSPQYTEHAALVRSDSIGTVVSPPSPEYSEHALAPMGTGSMSVVMPPIPEYSEHAADTMGSMMRPSRTREEAREQQFREDGPPGYSAIGATGRPVRLSWDQAMVSEIARA